MSDKSTMEVLLESLANQVQQLERQKKQLESRCKELTGEVEVLELDCAKRVAVCRETTDAKIAAIQAEVAPFTQLKSQVEASKTQLVKAKQALLDDTAALRAARQDEMARLDSRISEKMGRLARLTQEEEAFRARVLAKV